eukprot:2736398-Pyramimonas_sp.AAC.1
MPPARRCPHGVKHALKDKLDHHWLDDEGNVTWDPAARGGSDPMLPKGIGHFKLAGTKHLVCSIDGPIGT